MANYTNRRGLLSHISGLLNNKSYSDISLFAALDNNSREFYFCHKLILSLRSTVFSDILSDSSMGVIEVNTTPSLLYSFLKFLYTDELQIKNLNEAYGLLSLAKEYQVQEIQVLCYKYMNSNDLTLENVFENYENALKQDLKELLKNCRNFVSKNAKLIFDSKNFLHAPVSVISDITVLDAFTLSSEFEVILPVLKWCENQCVCAGMDVNDANLKPHAAPFLKNLRFLSLSFDEFLLILGKYDKLFTAVESSLITRKIMDPAMGIKIPSTICSISDKRCHISHGKNDVQNEYDFFAHSGGAENQSVRSKLSKAKSNIDSFSKMSSENAVGLDKEGTSSDLDSKDPNSPSYLRSQLKFHIKRNTLFDKTSHPSKSSVAGVNNSSTYESSQISPLSLSFPLTDIIPNVTTCFSKDVTCKIKVMLETGNISVSAVELKIKQCKQSGLTFNVYSSGFLEDVSESIYKTLSKNPVLLEFPKPLLLKKDKAELAVSVDNVVLDSLNILKNGSEICPLKDSQTVCSLKLMSTRKNEDGQYFFLSRIIYQTF